MSGSPRTSGPTRLDLARLHEAYGDAFASRLLGISISSVRRYRTGARAVPDAVTGRIHVVILVTDALAGSYTDAGLRSWWDRARSELQGSSPLAALGEGWDPRDPAARSVAMLASELTGRPASLDRAP